MIIDSFDEKGKQLITPESALSKRMVDRAKGYHIDTFIFTFSYKLIEEIKKEKKIEVLDPEIMGGSSAMKCPIYIITSSNTGVLLTGIGAPMASAMIEEINALFGTKNFIVFGSCGVLTKIPEGRLIIPTEAYRDEGTSFHYAKASDYIRIKNADRIAKIFDEIGVEYIKGKTWTTDAFYRETEGNRDKRIEEGCVCVEMECSALEAVCDFRGLELYQFVYGADSLNGEWSKRILGNLEMDSRIRYFELAKKIAEHLSKEVFGKTVTVTVDRPMGSRHPKYPDMIYPLNYGYVKGIMAADGEWQDAYLLGLDEAVEEYTGKVIAVIHRSDDVEEKWVVAPKGMSFTKEEIEEATGFQEKYFQSRIRMEGE